MYIGSQEGHGTNKQRARGIVGGNMIYQRNGLKFKN